METKYINPHRKTLLNWIQDRIEDVQSGCRARLLSVTASDIEPVFNAPSGYIELDGGGVNNSYSYSADTTYLMVAWVRRRGKKHVRAVVKRKNARQAAYGAPAKNDRVQFDDPYAYEAWHRVFPHRAQRRLHAYRQRNKAALERMGERGDDDSSSISTREMRIEAVSELGMVISDRRSYNPRKRARNAQVIVTDPATGERHHLTVPPRFGNPKTKTYQRLAEKDMLVRGAIAWTFDMKPEAYQPTVEC